MMQVKRYVAPTFAQALIQAKNELGTDAMIVESKKLRVGGIFGFFGRQMTELTMAVDRLDAGTQQSPVPTVRAKTSAGPVQGQAPDPALSSIERELATLRTAITRLTGADPSGEPSISPPVRGYSLQVFRDLVANGVEEALALDIARRLEVGGPETHNSLRRELGRLLGPMAPIDPRPGVRRVVALVGPTGVGKTTTVAKLAAQFALKRGLKVALITSDTFRIAAIDQLRTYADILGIPLHAVDSPADMAAAMRETAAFDVVLVDTGGRNHKDHLRMQELRELLAVLRPDETHLVCSATCNPRDAFSALESYLPLGVNRLTFTKIDEASAPGVILNLRVRCNQPLGYLSHGQSVPDDIIPADQADFTKLLLGA